MNSIGMYIAGEYYIDSLNCVIRISKLEMLDEVEELDLVLEHYAITWGLTVSGKHGAAWNEWGLRRRETIDEDEDV